VVNDTAAGGGLVGADRRNNSLVSNDVAGLIGADVTNDSLTGDDVNESSLGQVPSAQNAGDAGTLDGKDSADFVGSTQGADGDVSGPFSNLQLNTQSVGAAEVASNSLADDDIGVVRHELLAFIDTTPDVGQPTVGALDTVGPFTISRSCQKEGTAATARVLIRASATMSVDSTGPNGVNGAVDVPADTEQVLVSVGPTASRAFQTGSFAANTAVGAPGSVTGEASVETTSGGTCRWVLSRMGE